MKSRNPWAGIPKTERSAEMKRRRKVAKRNRLAKAKGAKIDAQTQSPINNHTHVCYGKVETVIQYYSAGSGVPFSTLASGVAAILQHQASR